MQIRTLTALALAGASAFFAPLHAQQEAPALRGPATFGVRMVESLREAGLAQPTGRFLLFVDAGGARVSFQGSNVPDSLQGRVLPLVNQYVASRGAAQPFHLSVQLEGMARPVVRELPEETREQLPQLVNGSRIREAITRVAQTHPSSSLDVRVVLKLYLSETGQVVLVEAPPTGDPDIDPYLTTIGHTLRFRPARINDEPVRVWVSIPLHFTR